MTDGVTLVSNGGRVLEWGDPERSTFMRHGSLYPIGSPEAERIVDEVLQSTQGGRIRPNGPKRKKKSAKA